MFSHEIAQNKILQWSLGALVFVYYVVLSSWIASPTVTTSALKTANYLCPVYFQSCEFFYFLEALPYGYSQSILYMAFFALLAWCVYLISQKAWKLVQLCLFPIFFWHSAIVLFASDNKSANYEYYLIAFGLVLLFFPHKEFFLKLTIVFFYTLSTVAKIHPSWIEGGYFNALRTGLPFFPDAYIPVLTNIVILMEMVGAWFLLSRNPILQRSAFVFFVIFHLYSGILVMYRYPATVLPFVLILFGPWYRYTPVPLDKKSLIGWSFLFLLFCLQISPKFIPGDEKLTMEGNKYGLYMFEANHQCFSREVTIYKDGTRVESVRGNAIARSRCQAYEYWFTLKKQCANKPTIDAIEWQFMHSINGGPFYKIVDVPNACALSFSAFNRNHWIKDSATAEVVGYPVRNIYK
jgi:hypothetical protein